MANKRLPEKLRKQEGQINLSTLAYYSGDKRQTWMQKRVDDVAFVYDQQWSPEDRKEMLDRGMTDFTGNRLFSILRDYESHLTGRVPEAAIVPTGNANYYPLTLIPDIVKQILYNSDWFYEFRRVVDSMLLQGMGQMILYTDHFSSNGLGDLKVKHIDNQFVYYDPTSSEPYFADSPSVIIAMPKLRDAALAYYPQYKDLIKKNTYTCPTGNYIQTTMQGHRGQSEEVAPLIDYAEGSPKVLLTERHVVELVAKQRVYPLDRWMYEYADQDYDYVPEKNREFAIPFYQKRLKKITSIGDEAVEIETLPVEYPGVVNMVYQDVRNPYPMGLISILKDEQRMWNKMYSLALKILEMNATPGTVYNKGSVDEKEIKDFRGLPGFMLGVDTPIDGGEAVKFEYGQGIPADFHILLQGINERLSVKSASHPYRQGEAAQLPHTADATQRLMQQADAQFIPITQTIDLFVERLYKNILQNIPFVYDVPRIMDIIINEQGDMQSVPLNVPLRQSAEGIWEVLNDLSKLSTVVRVRTNSSITTRHQEMAAYFTALYNQSGNPIFMEEAIKNTPELSNREEIISKLSVNAQLTQQLEGINKEFEELQGKFKNAEQQLEAVQKESATKDFENTLDSIIHGLRAEVEVFENRLADTLKSANQELRHAQSKEGRSQKRSGSRKSRTKSTNK